MTKTLFKSDASPFILLLVMRPLLLNEWPIDIPKDYISLVNIQEEAKEKEELESLRYSVNKGKPYGSNDWTNRMIDRFNLRSTLRNPGRPKKGG